MLGQKKGQTTLEEFLAECVEGCEPGAINAMCYRARFSQLYFAYRGRAMLRQERSATAGEFLAALRIKYPAALPARIRPEATEGALDLPEGYQGLEIDGVRFLGAPWKPREPARKYSER